MEKTNIMKFTSSCQQNEAFQIIYQNKIITGTNNTKFVGLELDKNINWKNHVQKIIPKLSSAYTSWNYVSMYIVTFNF
jgi:hypothetical protein